MRPVVSCLLAVSLLVGPAAVTGADARGGRSGVSGGGSVGFRGGVARIGHRGFAVGHGFRPTGFGPGRGTRLGFGPGYGPNTGIGFGPGYGPGSGFGRFDAGRYGYGYGGGYGGGYGYGGGFGPYGGHGRDRVASAYGIAAPPVQPPAVYLIGAPRRSASGLGRAGRRPSGAAAGTVRVRGDRGVIEAGPQIIRLSSGADVR